MSKPGKGRAEAEVLVAPFIMIPKAVVDSGLLALLRPSDLKVYLTIAFFAHYKNRYAFPGVRLIAEKSGINKNLIGQATNRLAAAGLITKKRASKCYRFHIFYKLIADPKINFSFIPLKTDKRRRKERGNRGRWGVVPRITESVTCPQKTEVITCPGNTDKKEREKDLKRDSFKKGTIYISIEKKREYEGIWGKKKAAQLMEKFKYAVDPAEEIASAKWEGENASK